MNVLHYINNLKREGAQVMVKNLVTASDNSEARYSVCVRQPGGSLVDELREHGINVFEPPRYFSFGSSFDSIRFLKRICIENQIQILHAHMSDAAFLAWLAARKLKLPLVISHHGFDILVKCNPVCRAVYYVLLNLAARYAKANIAVSDSVAERVASLLFLPDSRVQVISNGVSVPEDLELEARRASDNICEGSPVLLNLGRLVPLKGQRQLILALKQLLISFPDIRLCIVGDGELAADLKQSAKDNGVEGHIDFSGAVDDVTDYLAQADVYVSCSRSEGMPVAVLEAMAWRLPVVASDIPGNKSVVKHGETGFLYELHNTDALVQTIAGVLTDLKAVEPVASRARELVMQQFSASVAQKNHESLYKGIMSPVRA